MTNFYDVLNVSQLSAESEIKKAYRKLALKYHPDSNSGYASKERFIAVHEAYSILIDEKKRKVYDQLLNNTSPFNSAVTEEKKYTYAYSKKSKDLEDWIFEAQHQAIKYSKMSLIVFKKTSRFIVYHSSRLSEIGCGITMILPMVVMATLIFTIYTISMYMGKSYIKAVLLTIVSPFVYLLAYLFIRGVFEEISNYYKEVFGRN